MYSKIIHKIDIRYISYMSINVCLYTYINAILSAFLKKLHEFNPPNNTENPYKQYFQIYYN